MKLKKRLTALVLACFMVVSLLPSTAFAAEGKTECADGEHVWELSSILKHGTCTTEGIGKYVCSTCGKSEYQKSPVEHTKPTTGITTTNPTCGKAGSVKYTCAGTCGQEVTEEIPATGNHTWNAEGTVDATCTENAKVGKVCSVCGATDGEMQEVPTTALGHDYKASTGPDDGYIAFVSCDKASATVKKCSRCDDVVVTAVAATEHTWEDDDNGLVDATCTEPSGVSQHCTRCDATRSVSFDEDSPVYEAPTGHAWVKTEAVTATCEVAGRVQYWQCSNCQLYATGNSAPAANATTGLSETAPEAGEKAAHTYAANDQGEKKDVVKATCEVGESYKLYKTCTVCHQEILVETVEGTAAGADENAHVKVLDGTALKAATCTTTGIAKYKCNVCGKSFGYETMPAQHTYTETITKQATCTEDGEKTLSCSVCPEGTQGKTKTETIEASGHDYDDTVEANVNVTKEATCGEAGSMTVKCSKCDSTTTKTIPATGKHAEYDEDIVDATCTENAKLGSICKVCGDLESGSSWTDLYVMMGDDQYKAKGHDMVLDKTADGYVAATCTTGGTDTFKCSRCDVTSSTATGSLGHDWDEGEYVPATCDHAEGVLKSCKREDCEVTEFEAFPDGLGEAQKSHTWVHHAAVAATCEATGMPEYWQCSACNQYKLTENGAATTTAPTATAQKAHDYGTNAEIKKNEVKANCTDAGSYDSYKKCNTCNKEILQEEGVVIPVDPNAHVPALVGTALKAASCVTQTDGIGKMGCEKCDKNATYEKIRWQDAHVYSETRDEDLSSDATCEDDGEDVYVCTKGCAETVEGHTKIVVIEATGHDYPETPDATKSKAPTCGEAGKNVYVCANKCGVDEEEEVKATGEHDFEEDLIEATCTEPQKAGEVCSVCGATGEVTEIGEPLGHNLVLDTSDPDYKAATCTEGGKDVKVCDRENCPKDEADKANWRTVTVTTALDHDWGGDELVEATCDTAAGVKQTCQRGGCDETRVVPFTGELAQGATGKHAWVKHEAVAATCSAEGMPAYERCSVCEKYKAADGTATTTAPTAIAKLAHTPADAVRENQVDPTVDEDGSVTPGSYDEVVYCSVCDEEISRVEKTITHDANNHTYTVLQSELKKATCTTDGIGKYKCSACDATSYLTVKGGHVWSDGIETVEATCGKPGIMTYACDREGGCTDKDENGDAASKTETIPATGNHELEDTTTEATCTKPAMAGKACKNCDYAEEMKAVAGSTKLGHDWVKDTGKDGVEGGNKDATCTETGLQWYKCSREDCDGTEQDPGTKSEPINSKGHTPGEAQYIAATCTEGAKSVVKCTVCQEVMESTDLSALEPATGHSAPETKAASAATCIAKGKTAGLYCNACGKWVVKQGESYVLDTDQTHETAIDTTNGHSYDMENGKVTEEGSCDEDDPVQKVTEYECTLCGEDTTNHTKEVKEDVKHSWGEDAEVIEEATCTKPGKQSVTCSECGKEDTANVIPALGHDYSGEPEIVEATCTATGSKTWTCQNENCDEQTDKDGNGKTKVETLPMKDHEYEETYQDATCTKNAIAGQICKMCHEGKPGEFMEVPNSKIEHSWQNMDHEENTTDNDCTKEKVQWKKCSVCQEEKKFETAAGTHTPGTGDEYEDYTAATCTENGKLVVKCSVCGKVVSEQDFGTMDPATGHQNVTNKAAVAATCQSKGYQAAKFCTDCGQYVKLSAAGTYVVMNESEIEIAIDPSAHQVEITKTLKAATCGAAGIGKAECELCGADLSYVSIPATGEHTFADGTTTCTVCGAEKPCEHPKDDLELVDEDPATCTEDGTGAGVRCKVCGKIVEGFEPIVAKGHQWGDDGKCTVCGTEKPVEPGTDPDPEEPDPCENGHTWVVDPTDSTKHVCSKCDEEAEAHNWGTADADGKITCTKCGVEKPAEPGTDPDPEQPHEHSYNDGEVTTEPTCTENGVKTYTCTTCEEGTEGHTKTEPIAATGHNFVNGVCTKCNEPQCETHDFGDWETVKEATCTEKGSEKRTCSVCGHVETQETDAKGHTEVTVPGKAATCGEAGLTDGKKCSVCETVLEEQTTIAATGNHSWGDPFTEDGQEKHKCSVCDTVEVVGAHTHNYSWEVTKEATCTEAGTRTGTCSCGDTTTETIPATGHNWEVTGETRYQIGVTDDTITYLVVTTRTCSVCQETNTETSQVTEARN